MNTEIIEPKSSVNEAKSKAGLAASGGSATVESANAWAQVGRDCMKKAMEAIAKSCFGTADQYRKAADEAFAKELQLRESQHLTENVR